MRLLIYVGPAPSREDVLAFCAATLGPLASAVTLVSGGGRLDLVRGAAERLALPAGVPVELLALPGNAQSALLAATRRGAFDLVLLGRLNRPLARLLRRPRSKAIAKELEPSVLRVQGQQPRPLGTILLASGGDRTTLTNAAVLAGLAAPLGARVTLLHVRSQQSLLFEPPGHQADTPAPEGPELAVLREAQGLLEAAGVPTSLKLRNGPVIAEVLAEIHGGHYGMLAIGAHRVTSALDRILLEDLTGDLMDVVPISTLVVKRPGESKT
jgi:nucleotide-binding universal stress UspA family protein